MTVNNKLIILKTAATDQTEQNLAVTSPLGSIATQTEWMLQRIKMIRRLIKIRILSNRRNNLVRKRRKTMAG